MKADLLPCKSHLGQPKLFQVTGKYLRMCTQCADPAVWIQRLGLSAKPEDADRRWNNWRGK